MEIPLWLQITFQILLQLVLIILNAVFACAEIAAIELKGAKLDKLAENGEKRAKVLRKLTDNPARFLATIQVAITLSGFLASAFAAENFSVYIVAALSGKTLLPDSALNTISVILITILLSYVTLVFGELVPKRLAMKNSERVALALTGTVHFVSVAFRPLVWLLTVSTNGVLRLLGINPAEEESDVSEEEIRMLADAGSEQGIIDAEENEMIQNVFEFNDVTVGEIVTHRTEITVLWEEDSDEEWADIIKTNPYHYFPICGEDVDRVTGILDSRAYLCLDDKSRDSAMKYAVSRPLFVTERMKTNALFRYMKAEGSRIAIVVDEFGGTYGLVTLYDLVEQVMGHLDESDLLHDIVKQNEGYRVAGQTERESFEELLSIETDSDAATVGGWVLENMEKIPSVGDEFESCGVHVRVTKATPQRVLEIYAYKLPKEEDPEENA